MELHLPIHCRMPSKQPRTPPTRPSSPNWTSRSPSWQVASRPAFGWPASASRPRSGSRVWGAAHAVSAGVASCSAIGRVRDLHGGALMLERWSSIEYDVLFADHPPTNAQPPTIIEARRIADPIRRSTGAVRSHRDDARSLVLGNQTAASRELRTYVAERWPAAPASSSGVAEPTTCERTPTGDNHRDPAGRLPADRRVRVAAAVAYFHHAGNVVRAKVMPRTLAAGCSPGCPVFRTTAGDRQEGAERLSKVEGARGLLQRQPIVSPYATERSCSWPPAMARSS